MTENWDEFSKSLAESVPRRESLRRLGVVLAGAVLGPVGAAWASPRVRRGTSSGKDRCRTLCNCRDRRQQNACLEACLACTGSTSRLCGSCGSVYCADLANDPHNCGACGHACAPPGPWEYAACVNGRCAYGCVDGAVRCNGVCTSLESDPDNCGACGHACPASAPACHQGVCFDPGCALGLTWCDFECVDLAWDSQNCGACGFECPPGTACAFGVCERICYNCW